MTAYTAIQRAARPALLAWMRQHPEVRAAVDTVERAAQLRFFQTAGFVHRLVAAWEAGSPASVNPPDVGVKAGWEQVGTDLDYWDVPPVLRDEISAWGRDWLKVDRKGALRFQKAQIARNGETILEPKIEGPWRSDG